MRIRKTVGFTVYDLYKGLVFQRGHLERLSEDQIIDIFQEYNIQVVFGMARKENPVLAKLAVEHFIDYVYHPIPDGKLKEHDAESLLAYAETYSKEARNGVATLAYCNAGRNRSGLMNALLLRRILGVSGKEAMQLVRQERPRAIDNIHFEEFLTSLD